MATGQGVNFGFTSTGADDLARDFRKVGDNSAIAAKGARLCADALDKQRKAADVSAGATIALAKADQILADAEEELSGRAALADAALRGQGDAAKKAGRDSAAAAAGVSALAGTGGIPGGGLGALIAGGVALSPVIATLSVGLAGLGAAAVTTVGPILKAGTATQEAQKALASLDPAQKAAYDSLGLLKTQFGGFAKSLEPQVLGVFSGALRIASGLMADVQPVAKATGDALGGFLGQIDAEFRSRTWQDFFGFMAKEAGPDMQLVAGAILPLLDTLPKLLTDIQPIAEQFLKAAGGAARLADSAVSLNDKIQHLGTASGQSGGLLGRLADAGKKAVAQMLPGIPAAQALGKWLGVVGGNSGKAASGTGKAGDAFKGATPHAMSYAQWVQQSAKATTALMDAQSAAVSTQLAYGNDILTSANDAQTFHDKLKASKGMIGLHTQAQRDSFGAANTYIGDLARQASSAIASGHGTDAAITAIKNGLPALDTAKTKNKQYWQEVSTLVGWLKTLEQIKAINSAIHVNGTGVWSVTPGKIGLPGGTAGGPFAAGGLIRMGTGPTADDVMIRASRGELIVPANMVKAGAVDHLRGAIPGFASGGVAGSYGPGAVAGLPPWGNAELAATQRAVARDTAASMAAAINHARATAGSSVPGGGGGAARWSSQILTALAMLGQPGSLLGAVEHRMNQESGGNPFAVNRTDCLTLDYMILTRRGWLRHDEVQAGDETIGYNPETQRSEWTAITRVAHYEDAEVWRIGNKHWHADVTPNHRWWSDTLTRVQPASETCPECGWLPRGSKAPARGVQVHRNKIHGIVPAKVPRDNLRGEFVRTEDLRSGHRLRLAAPADTSGIPGLSLEDVRVLAWLQGDGSVIPVLAKPRACPECGWLPGTGRRPYRGPVTQPGNSVAVHRAKKHGVAKDRAAGELSGYDGRIWQSKPAQIVKIRALLATIEHTETVRSRGSNWQPAHCFILRRAYVTDLVKRSRLMENGPEEFVLALSPDQRAAWLDSMIDAEGHRQPVELAEGGKRHGASGEFVRIAQVDGPLQDAIKLAVYLEGYRPTFSANSAERNGWQPAGVVGMARPHVAPSMFNPREVLERQPVWCVTTELGTWTTRGGDDLPFLTGNSNWLAGTPSVGVLMSCR